jgi:hypothetical protein
MRDIESVLGVPSPMSRENKAEIGELVDHLFRHRAGQMVAYLTRLFGPEHSPRPTGILTIVMMLVYMMTIFACLTRLGA